MTISQFLPTVKCSTCQIHIGMKSLPSHVCPCAEPHRFSQISHYDDNNELTSQINQKFTKKPDLRELIQQRFQARKSPVNPCCRCHHSNASILIAEKRYHTKCFSCFLCHAPLDRDIPSVFEGQIYCNRHYKLAATRLLQCGTCENSIGSLVRPTIALNQYFHPEHLRCFHCHKTVDPITTGLKERKGKIYCQTDYNALFLPKCQSCQRAIEKEAVISIDGKLKGNWHKYCFKCQMCDAAFPNNRFYVYDNAPYCKLDYHKLNHSICHTCSLPIEGGCAEISNNWRFHPACFTCHTCKSHIQNVYYISLGNIYCKQHYPPKLSNLS
ncbi:unnamed protein product [Mucor circinelloides]